MARPELEVRINSWAPAWFGFGFGFGLDGSDDPEFNDTDPRIFFGYTCFGPADRTTGGGGLNMAPDIAKFSLRRGRSKDLQAPSAGTVSIELHDNDRGDLKRRKWQMSNVYGTADKFNSFRPYDTQTNYAQNPLRETIEVFAVTDVAGQRTRTQLFKGRINSWEELFFENDRHGVRLQATDGVTDLSQATAAARSMRSATSTTFPSGYTGDFSYNALFQWARADSQSHGLFPGDVIIPTVDGGGADDFTVGETYYIVAYTDTLFGLSTTYNGPAVLSNSSTGDWTLSWASTPPTFPQQTAGDRLAALCDVTSTEDESQVWPGSGRSDAYRDFDVGATVQASDSQDVIWNQMKKVAESTLGTIFVARDGKLTYRDLYSARTASGLTFSDDGAGSDIEYQTIAFPQNIERIFNLVNLYRKDEAGVLGDVPETASGSVSQAQFGVRELRRTGLLIPTGYDGDVKAQRLAELLRDNYKGDPGGGYDQVFPSKMTIAVARLSAADQASVLGLEIHDEINVELGARGAVTAQDIDCVIDNISMSITPGSAWQVTFGMSRKWDKPGDNARLDTITNANAYGSRTAVLGTSTLGI